MEREKGSTQIRSLARLFLKPRGGKGAIGAFVTTVGKRSVSIWPGTRGVRRVAARQAHAASAETLPAPRAAGGDLPQKGSGTSDCP